METNTTQFGSGNPSESSNFNNSLIANRYEIKKLIGKGGMGRVYLAEDKLLGGVNVALKFLTQSVSGDAKILRNFSREARICAILGNQNIHIVRVMDYGIHLEEDPYYVMEYLPGQSLKAILDSRPIPLLEFLTIIKQFCIGLESAHNGIELDGKIYPVIHRDIKPANVYICPDPTLGWLVKILDFGIAKYFSDHSSMTQTNSYIGTLAYSSPEQIEGGDLDLRSDLYSLGVMMYEMLTNKLPWQINNASFGAWYKAHHYQEPDNLTDVSTEIEIPQSLIDLVMSCLSKDRNNRPKNVGEIITNIALLQETIFPNFFSEKSIFEIEHKTAENEKDKTYVQPQNKPVNNPQTIKKPVNQGNITQVKTYFSQLTPDIEKACWASYWPKEKPVSPIVFPNFILTENERLTGLWVMLAKSDIQKHIVSICYNQFIFIKSPHPMLLWLTVIYNSENGFRWLPCYIDLKTPFGLRATKLLEKSDYYPLLFFTLEKPNHCILVRSSSINPQQRQLLKMWVDYAQTIPPGDTNVSKHQLKIEYERLKPTIAKKIELSFKNNNSQAENNEEEKVSPQTMQMTSHINRNNADDSTYKTLQWVNNAEQGS